MVDKVRFDKEKSEMSFEKEILSPYTHIIQVPGKQMRKKIIMALNYWLKISEDKLRDILNVCDMLHVSSLFLIPLEILRKGLDIPTGMIQMGGTHLIDDIQDNTNVRRGMPAAHCVYGVPLTINAAYYTVFTAMNKAFQINQEIPKIISELITIILRGQGMEIYWRDNFICPTEEQYMNMINLKASGFFDAPYRIIQWFSDNKTDYSNFITLLGCYFQIRDDYCNLYRQEALEEWPTEETKTNQYVSKENHFCEDITEGKFSFPVIHALQKPQGVHVLNILRQRTSDESLKKYCLTLLENLGSLQYTREMLIKLDSQLRAEVSKHGGNPLMEAALDELLSWQKS